MMHSPLSDMFRDAGMSIGRSNLQADSVLDGHASCSRLHSVYVDAEYYRLGHSP